MWNDKKSITLSKFCVLAFSAMLIGIALSAPWIVNRFLDFSRADFVGKENFFLSTIYSGSIPAAVLLYCLYRLLHSIEHEEVFISANVEYQDGFPGAASQEQLYVLPQRHITFLGYLWLLLPHLWD